MTRRIDALGREINVGYDDVGLVTFVRDGNAAAEDFVSDALGTARNNTGIEAPSGRTRIPDFIVEDRFVEVKNTQRLSGTAQIRDFADIAARDGKGPLVIVTRSGTGAPLRGALRDLIDAGRVSIINCLPG